MMMTDQFADDSIGALLNLHHVLEVEHDDGDKGNFLFGWQCENPFADDLIARTAQRSSCLNRVQYSYLEEDAELVEKIRGLHQGLDGGRPTDVFCGAGATALLVTFAAYLRAEGVEEVYFIPPIYFSLHFAMRLFGIRARPVSSRHAFEDSFTMNLPKKRTFLLLTDPVWYAGLQVPSPVLDEISMWQNKTGSTVLVDGSFQYMPWNKTVFEATARLDPSKTIRLISPSKSLCIAGYRFAYFLMPDSLRGIISNTYTNIYASASVDTIAFGHEAISAMETRELTNKLIDVIRFRHERLRSCGKTESALSATCGYFIFEKLNQDLPSHYVRMGGEFFDQARYPDYTRINLLSPSFHLLE
jgi:histidinol-phosphate/aromatic aminotransferase/cobyric acid decarboxylase-like protein